MSQTASLEEIYQPIDADVNAVVDTMLSVLSTPNGLTDSVVRYFFSAKGKLLRPALTFLGAKLKGGVKAEQRDSLLRLGAAYEIFHSATLIHDDIIDSAHIRRNLETVHLKWSPQVAVLVGDYMHDQSIKSIFEIGNQEIIGLFLKTAGEVCDGEIHELKERNNFDLTESEYLDIIHKKTASLLACALSGGALLAGATGEEKDALLRFGHYFGMAFQIVDDCLDLTGNQNEFGKTLGADLAAGVLTLPFIYLLSTSDATRKAMIHKSLASNRPDKLQELTEMVRDEGAIEYSLKRAAEFSDLARKELLRFEDSPGKRSLDRLLDYVLERSR